MHNVLYSSTGAVYGIGANDYNELGGHGAFKSMTKLKEYSKVIFAPQDIKSGYHRFSLKTHENKLYSIGNNYNGDCGVGHSQSNSQLTEISTKHMDDGKEYYKHLQHIDAGSNTLIFCVNDTIYATGISSGSIFGPDITEFSVNAPRKINLEYPAAFHKIIEICTDGGHILCLNENGQMFAWGKNDRYQCGIDDDDKTITSVTHLKCQAKIKTIQCGTYYNLCLSTDNKLYVFGDNGTADRNIISLGIYGDSAPKVIKTPTLHPYFKEKDIVYIQTKRHHSICIDSQKIAYLFGNNHHKQVSNTNDAVKEVTIFQKLYKGFENVLIEQGSCGNDHTLLLTVDNELIGFGGNTHFQCCRTGTPGNMLQPEIITRDKLGIGKTQRIIRVIGGDFASLLLVEE